jgi:hypothetical protein
MKRIFALQTFFRSRCYKVKDPLNNFKVGVYILAIYSSSEGNPENEILFKKKTKLVLKTKTAHYLKIGLSNNKNTLSVVAHCQEI